MKRSVISVTRWIPGANASALSNQYAAERIAEVDEFTRRIERLGKHSIHTPFQDPAWLETWYRTIGQDGTIEPVLVAIRNISTGADAMLLPLVLRRIRGLRVIMFADRSVSDYSFPILSPDAHDAAASVVWGELVKCLPKADLISLTKMPLSIADRENPLARLASNSNDSVRNFAMLPASWDEYLKQRSHKFRKTLRQKTRALQSDFHARFRLITDPAEAQSRLQSLSAFQRDRFQELGQSFVLDKAPFADFFRELVRGGLASASVILTTLETDNEVIATALTLRQRHTATMVRLAHQRGAWTSSSPSFVLVGETIKWLIENGVTVFDFGAGGYDYKQRFGCDIAPLVMIQRALSLKGYAAIAALYIGNQIQASMPGRAIGILLSHFSKPIVPREKPTCETAAIPHQD